MLLHNRQVVILGAGLVGLTLARLLQQQVTVTVYERDATPYAQHVCSADKILPPAVNKAPTLAYRSH